MNKPLGFGIALAGASLGWMVGASGSPIAGTAFPVVFAVVASVFSFLSGGGLREGIEKALAKDGLSEKAVDGLKELLQSQAERSNHASRMLGWALLCFFAFYLAGMGVGAAARIQNWFGGGVSSKPVPWSDSSSAPASLAAAVERIHLAENLERLGYSSEAVREILALPEAQASVVQRKLPEIWKEAESAPGSLPEAVYRLELAHRLEGWGYDREAVQFLLSLPVGDAKPDVAGSGGERTQDGGGGTSGDQTAPAPGTAPVTIPRLDLLPSPRPGFPIQREELWEKLFIPGVPQIQTPSKSLDDLKPSGSDQRIFER